VPIAVDKVQCQVQRGLLHRLSHARYACNGVTILYQTQPPYAAAAAVREKSQRGKVPGARALIAVVSDINGEVHKKS
jgi:hypothetical protein